MPRGKKRSLEDKINDKLVLIESLEVRIQKERDELSQLENEKKLQEVENLHEFIQNAQITSEEAIHILQSHIGAANTEGAD